jgi:bleomycin hydrolase
MGLSGSKQTVSGTVETCVDEKQEILDALCVVTSSHSSEPTLSEDDLAKWGHSMDGSDVLKLAASAISNGNMLDIIKRRDHVIRGGVHVYSHTIPKALPVVDQKSSGRCWLFASTNIMRVPLIKKLNLSSFQYSQSYLFFYDKLEKANYFLESMIELADKDIDSRLMQHLLSAPVNDGGQFDFVVNLVNKYGLLPHDVYPDAFNATASSRLNWLLTTKLRENALILRSMVAKGEHVGKAKFEMMQQVYNMLVVGLGQPPKPTESFTWEYLDKNDKFHRITTTPKHFYKDYANFDVDDHFSLLNDPRNPYGKLYTVDKLKNIKEGIDIRYVNTDRQVLKEAIVRMIKDGRPVFFGCDVGQFSDSKLGLMDTGLFDYKLAFGINLGMSKSQRIKTGTSAMTHAMVISGVNLDKDGKPTHYRVENSWGETAGQGGYFMMTDEWFNEYVYQIVVSTRDVSKSISDILQQDPVVLSPWDKMGALA